MPFCTMDDSNFIATFKYLNYESIQFQQTFLYLSMLIQPYLMHF